MEFLRVVEEELRGLAAEARRRHPVVQEAAERAILKLRNMREEYAVALRQQNEGKAPPLSMFRSQDLLRPFLLACNHADASPHLMIMAMGSMQYLINRDAILPSDAPNILRVLAIQSQSKDADVQKRVLQTMVMVVTWKSCDMTEDTVAQALGVCLGLHDAKNAMVRTAADMTVRQIISLLFDRVADELGVTTAGDAGHLAHTAASGVAHEGRLGGGVMRVVDGGGVAVEQQEGQQQEGRGSGVGKGALRCAHLVFQDLCVLSRGEQGQWIKRTSVSITLGLELVEQVLSQQPILFRKFESLRRLLSQEVCPLILHTLRRRMNFPLLVRLLRAASTLVVTYGDLLPIEARAVLSGMLNSLGTGVGTVFPTEGSGEGEGDATHGFTPSDNGSGGVGGASWAAALTLEAIHRVLSTPRVALELFRHGAGDAGKVGEAGGEGDRGGKGEGGGISAVEEILQAVNQHLVRNLSSQNEMQGLESMAQSIRLGRHGSSSTSASQGEGKRLPLPPCVTEALSREEGKGSHRSSSSGNASLANGKGSGGGGGGEWSGSSGARVGGASTNRSSSLELLHETEQPNLDDAELLLWGLQCVVDVAESLSSLVDDEFHTSDTSLVLPSSVGLLPEACPPSEDGSRRRALRNMCEALWGPVLLSLSHVMGHCSDPLVVSAAVGGNKSFAVAAGILGVTNAVDGFVGSLCRFSVPQRHGAEIVGGAGGGAAGGGASGGGGQAGGSLALTALSWNHVGTLESLLQVVHRLGNLLRGSWHVVLDTLEQAAELLGRRAIARPRWSPQSPEVELAAVESHCSQVLIASERLVQFSTCLEDEALYALMSSLQALAVVSLANTATVLPQERTSAREREAAQLQANQNGASGEGRGAGAAAVAAASGLVSLVGAAARGVGAAMSEGREAMQRDSRNSNSSSSSSIMINSGKFVRGTGESKGHVPWVSSHLVVQCAVANTWRLAVVWELVSGHLRVIAKAREPGKREYAVRALRELVVDGVKRLHPLPLPVPADAAHVAAVDTDDDSHDANPQGARSAGGAGVGYSSAPPFPRNNGTSVHAALSAASAAMATSTSRTPPTRTPTVCSAASSSRGSAGLTSQTGGNGGGGSGGSGSGEQEEGFLPNFLGLRARLEGVVGGEDEPFRWVFDSDVGGVFLAVENRGAGRKTTVGGEGGDFEAVLFRTMGLFALTPHVDTREATLQTLYTILQSCGQVLESAWPVILNLLHSVAKGATDATLQGSPRRAAAAAVDGEARDGFSEDGSSGGGGGGGGGGEDREDGVNAGGEMVEVGREMRPLVWGGACVSLAFKCLQLIVDEFVERLPRDQVPKLVTCVGAFGGQTERVNLSLTAIGMLWTVCDTFADAADSGTGTSSEGSVGPPGSKEQRSASFSPSSPSSSPAVDNPPPSHPSLRSMWPTMLFQLRNLAVDFRPELRNCAVNTLFSAAVGNGDGLTESEWKQFLLEVTFPLMNQVLKSTNSASRGANTAVAPELKKGVRMLMHHTRDTDQKQWNETRVLAMQGLGRVLRAYVTVLARWDWFSREGGVWAKSLEVYRDACLVGSDSQEVALCGVDGITTMVLLVGKMGLKSVQVRAGVGMKIVDGTLQRSAPSQISTPAGKVSGGGGSAGAAATGGDGGRGSQTDTPEFAAARPALYAMAWAALAEASRFQVDESGDVAPAFVEGLAAVYKAGVEDGSELSSGQEGEEGRMKQLFQMLDGLFSPRVPATGSQGSPGQSGAARRPAYMPKVTPGQRAVLEFLQEDLRSGWRLAMRLLAKYSVAEEGGGGEVGDDENGASSAPPTVAAASGLGSGGAIATGPGGVSLECVKEAASALSVIMSKETVPKRDRALALEGLLSEVSGPCVRRLEGLQEAQRQQRRQGLSTERKSMAGLLSPATPTATPTAIAVAVAGGASEISEKSGTGNTVGVPVSAWPSLDSYTEVLRLLLALLNDGLPSLTDAAAFRDQNKGPPEHENERNERLVSCFKVAISGVAAIAECRRIKMSFLEENNRVSGLSLSTGGGRGRVSTAAGGRQEFPRLLREVLVVVTSAVHLELTPLAHKFPGGAREVIRSLIDTLGAITLPPGDVRLTATGAATGIATAWPPEERGISCRSSRDVVGGASWAVERDCGTTGSASTQAFGFAVEELARICGEDGVGGAIDTSDEGAKGARSWALLGLPLRRRACWHLLRCAWSAARHFRSMEDDLDLVDVAAAASEEAGLTASPSPRALPDGRGDTKSLLAPAADRCTCALAAAGKVRLPLALLTPGFKKLVAMKQAQEIGLLQTARAPARAPNSPPVSASSSAAAEAPATSMPSSPSIAPPADATSRGDNGGAGEGVVGEPAATDDDEWATIAEEDRGEGLDGDGVIAKGEPGGGGGSGSGGGGGLGDVEDGEGYGMAVSLSSAETGREHLVLLCRPLLACSWSRTERVRRCAALLLAEADLPGALYALQEEVAVLQKALGQREAQLVRKNMQVADLRAQVAAAGAFM